MDSSKIKVIVIVALAAFAALYLGISAATNQIETVAWVVGTCAIILCVSLGRHIWLLMHFLSALGLTIYYLPGKPDTGQIGQLIFLAFSSILFLTRKLPFRVKFTELEFFSLLFIICVAQAYLRNPVGLNTFGSARVGGRPYFDFALTLATSFVLSTLIVSPKELIWLWRLSLLGAILSTLLATIGYYIPRVGYWLGSSSGAGLDGSDTESISDSSTADRKTFAGMFGRTIALWISSERSPLKALFNPLFAALIVISVIAAAYSGFRNYIATVGLTYLVGIFYRNGLFGVALSAGLGILGVIVISLINSISPLPANIQRAMTIFPGSWEQRQVDDAKNSTEWRVEMWVEALTNKRYIANTLFGDGLGMSSEQLAQSISLDGAKNQATHSGFNVHRENAMLSGAYHSGPVQTIRTTGYVGLMIWLIAISRVMVHAHRQIIRCRNTEWYNIVLFLCIPIICGPIFWIFIYGTFMGAAGSLFIGAAILRLLENNLPLPSWQPRSLEPYLLGMNRNVVRTTNAP